MKSIVWDGDLAHEQDFGCTDLTVEPWWPAKACHWHCGIDVSVAKGAQLRAARAGMVAVVGLGELGISVIGTDPPERDFYIHIDRSLVSPGQMVARGQVCAISGDKVPSGGVLFGAHLHFERQTGHLNSPLTSRDPVPVLTGQFSGGSDSLSTSTGGSVALAPHPTMAGRVDELFVGADKAIWHVWGDVSAMDPAAESWGGQGVPGTLSAAWTPDGNVLIASVVGTDSHLWRKALRVDGSVLYDWNAVQGPLAAIPGGSPGPKGDKGDPGKDGAPGKDGVSPTAATIAGPIKVTLS